VGLLLRHPSQRILSTSHDSAFLSASVSQQYVCLSVCVVYIAKEWRGGIKTNALLLIYTIADLCLVNDANL